jgi:hypothetical protein
MGIGLARSDQSIKTLLQGPKEMDESMASDNGRSSLRNRSDSVFRVGGHFLNNSSTDICQPFCLQHCFIRQLRKRVAGGLDDVVRNDIVSRLSRE